MGTVIASVVGALYLALAEPARSLRLRRSRLASLGAGDAPDLPVIEVETGRDGRCSADCGFAEGAPKEALERYLDPPAPAFGGGRFRAIRALAARSAHPTPMVIDLGRFPDMQSFEATIRRRSSRTLPKARKATAAGYEARRFALRRHVFDIHEIKTSASKRAGGLVLDYWFLKPEDVGVPADRPLKPRPPRCPRHWELWWGVFQSAPGHRQGEVEVGEKLVAFVKLRRRGDLLHYADIMGHSAHLDDGVMILLHLSIMRWLIEGGEGLAEDARALIYGGVEHGRDGLLTWKKRAGFEPAWLALKPSDES